MKAKSPKQSAVRLILYVLIAMVTAASAGIMTVDFSNPKQTAFFALAVIFAGLTNAQSYLDQSAAKSGKTPKQASDPGS